VRQTKYKQAKSEAGSAQNTLQKEITTLRDANRTLQLKLRDIEVTNDDYERQARNTSSSLEDMEQKFNQAIERGVMLEEEIRIGEQEREGLRIETQRLRDELGDLKIEAEIMQDKLKKQTSRALPALSTDFNTTGTPSYDGSPTSTASSPLVTTPPDSKSVSTVDTVSETPTPPSPPRFDASAKRISSSRTPINSSGRIRHPSVDLSQTPKARLASRTLHSSRPSISSTTHRSTPSVIRTATSKAPATKGVAHSASLSHIRSLTAQMQRLEQRVHSARAKLPSATSTPPRNSPRYSQNNIPPSVTIRSRKRTSISTASAGSIPEDSTPSQSRHVSRVSTSGINRLSYGPPPKREATESESSRPSSRASGSAYSRTSDRPSSRGETARPSSRASLTGTRTPLGHYSQSSLAESRRPRSSMGGSYAALHATHGHSQSVSHIDIDEGCEVDFRTPGRRNSTFGKDGESCIPIPTSLARRQSGGIPVPTSASRRTSSSLGFREGESREIGTMRPPPNRARRLSGVGETY
jgi:hypothetical protein